MIDLTIGMACYDDFRGVLYTIQSLKMHHPDVINRCELLVVNNNPDSEQGRQIDAYLDSCGPTEFDWDNVEKIADTNVSYITDWKRYQFARVTKVRGGEKVGTSFPRDQVFRLAAGRIVMCIDAHVLLPTGAIESLLRFYAENPNFDGLVQGPMLYDQLATQAGSFTDTWGAEMWGQWQPEAGARDKNGPPFEIQSMGLGLFACKKDEWLGFNPMFEGFGGEEWYIHEKYRKHGKQCLSLPALRWWHDFSNRQRTYPLKRDYKVRNYIIGHLENGTPMDRLREHFKQSGLTDEQFDRMVEEVRQGMGSNIGPFPTIEAAYQDAIKNSPDIGEHIPTLRELASKVNHITEFGVRTGYSTAGLLAGLAGRPGTVMRSYDINPSPDVDRLRGVAGCDFAFQNSDVLTVDIDLTDLLFIDTLHTGIQCAKELGRHYAKVRRFLVFHDTVTFGEAGECGGQGLLFAIRGFLMRHPEWKVIRHDTNNNGLTVLSRNPEDFPATPIEIPKGGAILPQYVDGPGTELKEIITSLGVEKKQNCGCDGLLNEMNMHGVAGCRKNFWRLVGTLKDNAEGYGWGSFMQAGFWAVWTGLAWSVNPLDPFPGMITEAIRRAEAKGLR